MLAELPAFDPTKLELTEVGNAVRTRSKYEITFVHVGAAFAQPHSALLWVSYAKLLLCG